MLQRPVYTDASPLIGLARIGRLDLLTVLPCPIRVTLDVWREVTGASRQRGASDLVYAEETGLLMRVDEGDPADYPMLDAGEASVLSAARIAGGGVIIDERKARAILESDPQLAERVPYVTTVALVVLSKNAGLIDLARPILDQLRRETFRMSDKLYEDALQVAGERDP